MQNQKGFGKCETSGIRPLVICFLCSLQAHHLPPSSSSAWDTTPLHSWTEREQEQVISWILQWYQPLWITLWSLYIARATRCPVCVQIVWGGGQHRSQDAMGLGSISCKIFNLGCVLQPEEKSKLPDGTVVTISSSLHIWQEVFAAPCFPDDRLLWFDLACFKGVGYLRGGVCMPVSRILTNCIQHRRICVYGGFALWIAACIWVKILRAWLSYQRCNIYSDCSFRSLLYGNLFPLRFSVILRGKLSWMAPCSREFWGHFWRGKGVKVSVQTSSLLLIQGR